MIWKCKTKNIFPSGDVLVIVFHHSNINPNKDSLSNPTSVKKIDLLSPSRCQLPITPWQGLDLPALSSSVGIFCLVWACSGIVHAVTVCRSSYVYLLCYIWTTLPPLSHLPPLAFKVFLLPLPHRSWAAHFNIDDSYAAISELPKLGSATC